MQRGQVGHFKILIRTVPLPTITPTPPLRITKEVRAHYHWEYVLSIQCIGAEERVPYPGKQSAKAERLLPLPSIKPEKTYFKGLLLEDN